jgi:hypothetical protein
MSAEKKDERNRKKERDDWLINSGAVYVLVPVKCLLKVLILLMPISCSRTYTVPHWPGFNV